MSTDLFNPPLYVAEPIRDLLTGLRRKIRSYVWLQGIALAVAWLAASFWITLALDWMIEPPPAFRALVLVAVTAVLLWLIYRYILARAFVPMGDTSMAVLLERRYGEFNDSLLTTVELAGKPAHAAAFNPEMLDWTTAEALGHTRRVRLNELLQNAALMRAVFAAIVLSLSVAAFAVAVPAAFEIWARRVLLMSPELWPRKTHLSIEGFNDDKLVKVARGGDFRVVAYADRAAEVPEIVQIRFRDDEGNPGRQTMAAEAVGPGDDRQAFSHNFPGLLASLTFDIVGGDDRLRDYRIEVVDNPTVSNMTLHCVYPAYMRRGPRDLPVTGLMQIPVGTKVTIRADANKPLEIAHIERVVEQGVQPLMTISQFRDEERRVFSLELPPLVEDMRLQFRLHDTDGIVGRNPVRLDLAAIADEAPKVGLQLRGIGTAITTQARLPMAGEVADDYGVERIWFEYQVDDAEPQTAAFLASPGGKDALAIEAERPEVLDLKELQEVAELQLKEDQRLALVVKAQDQSTLEGGPFIGIGEKYQLDVVSPDRLLAMLEARELQLRQRFETIIEEFTATRDLLVRVDVGSKSPADRSGTAASKSEGPLEGAEPEDAASAKPKDAEPQDEESQLSPAAKAAQERASRLLAVERTLENTQRAAHETRTVGTAFHEILEEMANNRIDTPALSGRLRDEIADPLVALADKRLPVLVTRLSELQKLVDDASTGRAKLNESIREADEILLEMQAILDKMIEMATYKELVEKLRKVIEQQEELNKATKQRQVENLKKLIEE
ncbi:MAG: hypothetical protein WD894_11510 [Pirellulales bacterium]